MVTDGDFRDCADILGHDVGLLKADGKTKLCACLRKAGDESLEAVFGVCSEGSIISKQQLPYENPANLGPCLEAGEIEEVPITPSVDEDAIFRPAKGLGQEQGEEHAEKSWG